MPSHAVGAPFSPQNVEMKTSCPISRSFLAQMAVCVPYPDGDQGAQECHNILLTRDPFLRHP